MAGGTFSKLVGKDRPGTYINFETSETSAVGNSERGIVIMPLVGFPYGPAGEFITIDNSSPDANYEKLGYSVYEAPMLLVKEALKKAKTVIAYIPAQGDKATGSVTLGAAQQSGTGGADVTVPDDDDDGQESGNSGSGEESAAEPVVLKGTAMYGGSRGNALSFDCVANEVEGFDVTVYLDNTAVETVEGIKTVGELKAAGSAWLVFTGDDAAELTAFSAISLTGGSNGTMTAQNVTAFLDKSEGQTWNTMAFPITDRSLIAAFVSKIKYLREDVGKYRKGVCADYAADYEGIINVTNAYKLSDGTELTHAQATAWVAGVDAGASITTSNTYAKVEDAADVVDLKSHAEAVAAIKAGEFFFSFNEQSEVAVEYDINSLTSFGGKKGKSWRKNRVLRVMDSFGETVMVNFPPNKYDNNDVGWDVMEGIGKSLLKTYLEEGAITNVDYDNDFKVDRTISKGDETYFDVDIQPVDSSEKLFFTVRTR